MTSTCSTCGSADESPIICLINGFALVCVLVPSPLCQLIISLYDISSLHPFLPGATVLTWPVFYSMRVVFYFVHMEHSSSASGAHRSFPVRDLLQHGDRAA
jgi:hypothetical protein